MKRGNFGLAVIAACAIVGCAQTTPFTRTHWVKEGATKKDYRTDIQQCLNSDAAFDGVEDGGWVGIDDAVEACMQHDGWRRVKG